MSKYKIKGCGDTRDVYDGERLVGHVHRVETEAASAKVHFDPGGRVRSAAWTKRKVVRWRATWPNGDVVRRDRDKRTLVGEHLKTWADPTWWALAEPPEAVAAP